jgi:hypothetical protein
VRRRAWHNALQRLRGGLWFISLRRRDGYDLSLEKSRLRRFFRTAASLPPAKGVTFAGCLVETFSVVIINTPQS